MNEYLLLLHETPADYGDLSAAQMQEIVAAYAAWAEDLAQRGLLVSGKKLADDGGRHLRAGAAAQAEALAAGCPHLRGRNWIEVRRIEIV